MTTHRLFLCRHLRSVSEHLLGNRPISNASALFLTNVFYFIYRLRGLSLCSPLNCLCRLLFIHSLLNCGSKKAPRTARHDTTPGLQGRLVVSRRNCTRRRCTELQASRSSSRPVDRRGSPVRRVSITRDTPR